MSSAQQEIQDTVQKFVSDGFMFTAFDITRTVRKAVGKSTFVSHSDVNNAVQSMHNSGDLDQYVRNLINVGANVEPWLYYHPYSDVANYDPHWGDNNLDQDGMKADTASAPASASGGYAPASLDLDDEDEDDEDEDDDADTSASTPVASVTAAFGTPTNPIQGKKLGKNEHRVTKAGRLQIPINMARTAGFAPYQSVSIINGGDTLTVQGLPIPASNTVIVQVNRDGRIRLSQKILKAISSTPKSDIYKVERDNNEIVIQTV